MSDYKIPLINKMQFGVIDEKFVNSATRLANDFADLKPQLDSMMSFDERGFLKKPILAKIKDFEVVTEVDIEFASGSQRPVEVAWKYKWDKVSIVKGSEIIAGEGGEGHPLDEYTNSDAAEELHGAGQGLAYNIAEMANAELAPIVFGVDMETSAYPQGFRPQPADVGTYVLLSPHYCDEDGFFFYTFDRQGVHDGACSNLPAPPIG